MGFALAQYAARAADPTASSTPERHYAMVQGVIGNFDTRFERLTRPTPTRSRGELKPGDRFPSARELGEMHAVGRTTAGRVPNLAPARS